MNAGDTVSFQLTYHIGKTQWYARRYTEGIVTASHEHRPTVACVIYDSPYTDGIEARKKDWKGEVPVEFLKVTGRQTTIEDAPIGV